MHNSNNRPAQAPSSLLSVAVGPGEGCSRVTWCYVGWRKPPPDPVVVSMRRQCGHGCSTAVDSQVSACVSEFHRVVLFSCLRGGGQLQGQSWKVGSSSIPVGELTQLHRGQHAAYDGIHMSPAITQPPQAPAASVMAGCMQLHSVEWSEHGATEQVTVASSAVAAAWVLASML